MILQNKLSYVSKLVSNMGLLNFKCSATKMKWESSWVVKINLKQIKYYMNIVMQNYGAIWQSYIYELCKAYSYV